MRKRYVWDEKLHKLVEQKERKPAEHHFVWEDLKPYQSPVTLKMVEGRYQRREDLKISGCREVDPSEIKYADKRLKEMRDAPFFPENDVYELS